MDAQKRIGLNCTESLILIPRKSVTAVIGISKKKFQKVNVDVSAVICGIDVNTEKKRVSIVDFKQLLKNEFICLDGAMGTMLQAMGLKKWVRRLKYLIFKNHSGL